MKNITHTTIPAEAADIPAVSEFQVLLSRLDEKFDRLSPKGKRKFIAALGRIHSQVADEWECDPEESKKLEDFLSGLQDYFREKLGGAK